MIKKIILRWNLSEPANILREDHVGMGSPVNEWKLLIRYKIKFIDFSENYVVMFLDWCYSKEESSTRLIAL